MKLILKKIKSTLYTSKFDILDENGDSLYKAETLKEGMSYFSYIYKNEKLLYTINRPFKLFRGNKTPSHYIYDSNNIFIGSIIKNGFTVPTKISFKNINFICYLVGLGD